MSARQLSRVQAIPHTRAMTPDSIRIKNAACSTLVLSLVRLPLHEGLRRGVLGVSPLVRRNWRLREHEAGPTQFVIPVPTPARRMNRDVEAPAEGADLTFGTRAVSHVTYDTEPRFLDQNPVCFPLVRLRGDVVNSGHRSRLPQFSDPSRSRSASACPGVTHRSN